MKYETIRETLVEIISGALPETDENIDFCGSDSFTLMLDTCIQAIRKHFDSILEED